jgi:hypothetical protein
MEFGSYDSKTAIWTFRVVTSAQALWTITSEMSKSKGAVRHYCRYHIIQMQVWPPAKPSGIWPIEEQLAYAKQLEMAEANV